MCHIIKRRFSSVILDLFVTISYLMELWSLTKCCKNSCHNFDSLSVTWTFLVDEVGKNVNTIFANTCTFHSSICLSDGQDLLQGKLLHFFLTCLKILNFKIKRWSFLQILKFWYLVSKMFIKVLLNRALSLKELTLGDFFGKLEYLPEL